MTASIPAPYDDTRLREERRRRIGSSDVAAILGKSKWKTPLDVWRRLVHGEDDPAGEPARWGTLLEPVIREEIKRRQIAAGVPAHLLIEPGRTYYGECWEVAHLDAELPADDPAHRGVGEIKCDADYDHSTDAAGDKRWGRDQTDEVPYEYLVQVQWQLALSGLRWAKLYRLKRGSELVEYVIAAHPALQAQLRAQMAEWYAQYVVGQVEPPPVGEEDYRAAHPTSEAKRAVVLPPEAVAAVVLLRTEIKQAEEALERRKERARLVVMQALGDAEIGQDPAGQVLVTWKSSESRRLDTEAVKTRHPEVLLSCSALSTSRRLLLKDPK